MAAPTLASQASGLANQSIAATIAGIRAQQAQALAAARQRATQIQAAAQAAARFQGGLGDKTAADYRAAVGQTAGLASGYTGQLRTDAEQAAREAQASLASVPGNTQTVQDRGPSLANLLYGLGGAIPANALETTGLGATAAARTLPSASLGYGMAEAAGALGAGRQTAEGLTANILAAQAQRPQLVQGFLGSLSGAEADRAQTRLASQLAQSLIDSRTKAGTVAQQNADTRETVANKPPAPPRPVTVSPGSTLVDPSTGAPIYTAPPRSSTSKPRGGLTANAWSDLTQKALADANAFYKGVAPDKQYVPDHYDKGKLITPAHWIPVPGTGSPGVPYSQALAELLARNPSKAWADYVLKTLNGLYAPGEGGRPKSAAQIAKEKRQTKAAAQDAAMMTGLLGPGIGA